MLRSMYFPNKRSCQIIGGSTIAINLWYGLLLFELKRSIARKLKGRSGTTSGIEKKGVFDET